MEKAFDHFGLDGCATFRPNLVAGNIKKGMRAIGAASDMYMVCPRKVQIIEGFNPRIKDDRYWAGIHELALGMKEHGFYRDKPLAGYVGVKDGEEVVYVTEGHRRHDAALYWMNELDGPEDLRIPFVPKPRGTTELDLNYALIESNKAQDFRPYELAMQVKRLHVAYGQDEATIAQKMGKPVATVRNLLTVAGAPEAVAKMVLDEELSITEAAAVLNTHKDKAVEVLAQAKANSTAAGKTKVSRRFMPGQKFKSAIKKESETIYEVVRLVREDAGFERLAPETRQTVESLVSRMVELEAQLAAMEAKVQSEDGGERVEDEAAPV